MKTVPPVYIIGSFLFFCKITFEKQKSRYINAYRLSLKRIDISIMVLISHLCIDFEFERQNCSFVFSQFRCLVAVPYRKVIAHHITFIFLKLFSAKTFHYILDNACVLFYPNELT